MKITVSQKGHIKVVAHVIYTYLFFSYTHITLHTSHILQVSIIIVLLRVK